MKSFLTTCALFLVLPWKLSGETTHSPDNTIKHKGHFNDHKATIRDSEATNYSTTSILHWKTNKERTSSTIRHEDPSKNHEASSISILKTQGDYINKGSNIFLSSRLTPQTSEHQNAEYLTHAMTTTTEEYGPVTHLSLSSLTKTKIDKITITTLPQKFEEVIITRDDHKTLHNYKSSKKSLDRHTYGNRTTRSAEKSFTPKIKISTDLQKTTNTVVTVQSEDIQHTVALETSPHQESRNNTIPDVTGSSEALDNEENTDITTTLPNISTTSGFTNVLGPTIYTEVGITGTAETMETKAILNVSTKDPNRERTGSNPNNEIIRTLQTVKTKSTTPISFIKPVIPNPSPDRNKDTNNKSHPGYIIASLIGGILFLMFVAFFIVLIRKHFMKKKQMELPDWAGPSPFIECDIHPNVQTSSEEGSLHCQESKGISLHSFLHRQFSKRLSMLAHTDEVPLEDTQARSTFGQCYVTEQNGKATPDQIQTHEANSPLDPEAVIISPAAHMNENIQPSPKDDHEIIPPPLAEKHNDPPTPFEDVDLSVDKNSESTSSDVIYIPPPPPLMPP